MNSLTDYTQTQRVVLLIDLNPILHTQQNHSNYLNAVVSSLKILLNFPSLSSSLFSFKLFFSSLSPLLSSSKLSSLNVIAAPHLSFDTPHNTLNAIIILFNSISGNPKTASFNDVDSRKLKCETIGENSNGVVSVELKCGTKTVSCGLSNVAASMRQLLYDYTWEVGVADDDHGTGAWSLRSNLVVLFSPVSGFLGDVNEEFCRVFKDVYEKFVVRDIHFSWVDVMFEGFDEKVRFLERGIRGFGWGFCSSESLIVGSALAPFGLVYPEIGVSMGLSGCDESRKKGRGQLNLEISDVSGKPLECKCCELELVGFKVLSKNSWDDVFLNAEFASRSDGSNDKVLDLVGNASVKFHVKCVQRNEELARFEGKLLDPVLVCERSRKYKKDREGSLGGFTDAVIEFMRKEMGAFEENKVIPVWNMFLSFLYREGYWALVFLPYGSSDTLVGVLKPFTVSLALLSVIDPQYRVDYSADVIGGISSPKKHGRIRDRKEKKNNKRDSNFIRNLDWNGFRRVAFEFTEIGLEEIFFAMACDNSKKLKFLKCWMKQISKSSDFHINIAYMSKSDHIISRDTENRFTELQQESKQPSNRLTELVPESQLPISTSASAGDISLTETSRTQDEDANDDSSETMEGFFANLSSKINKGVEFTGIDLAALAERLLSSSIYWLCKKCEMEAKSESQKSDDTFGSSIASELMKLLLIEPRDLASKHKNDFSLPASDVGSGRCGSGNIVREYELQILFRMEILQSQVSAFIKESIKQKFIKQNLLSFGGLATSYRRFW